MTAPDHKTCSICGEILPAAMFGSNGPGRLRSACRACRSSRRRERHAADPARERERASRWRAANKGRVREHAKADYDRHRAKRLQGMRAYRSEHGAERNARRRRVRSGRRDELNARNRAWREAHQELVQVSRRRHRSRHRDRLIEASRAYYSANRDSIRDQQRRYQIAHMLRINDLSRKRRRQESAHRLEAAALAKAGLMAPPQLMDANHVLACTCCGETIPGFLVMKRKRQDGSPYARHFEEFEEGYSPEFEIYCRNCEKSISAWGVCAHIDASAGVTRSAPYIAELRREVFDHYSGGHARCECCGEYRVGFLRLTMPNGKGPDRIRPRGGTYRLCQVYRQLADAGFPAGHRVLCRNCSHSIYFRGTCAHHDPTRCIPEAIPVTKKRRRRGVDRSSRIEKFWRNVDRSGGNESCWLWLGRLDEDGYGRHWWRLTGTHSAHRISWMLTHGPIPEDRPIIDHVCRNRRCCNPHINHLEPVTHMDNVRRGVAARMRGES